MVQSAAPPTKVSGLVTFFLAALLFPPALVTGFFVLEVLFGLPRDKPGVADGEAELPVATLIIPAHDEEAVIAGTLEGLKAAVPAGTAILVVADNCTDKTAQIAAGHGVRVVERSDQANRGKGHALSFARSVLASDPTEVVVIVDADCAIDRPSLVNLIVAAVRSGRPSQAINLLRPSPGAEPMVQISTFAFMLKNVVRQRGLHRLSGRVHLTGTGMALPWKHFAAADLATSSIVEDIRLGFELADAGSPPQLVERAIVWSNPSSGSGTLVQRRRWEGGFLQMARRTAPRALGRSLRRLDPRGFAAGLDLCVPPLALLVIADIGLLLLAAAATAATGTRWWPVLTLGAMLAAAGVAILSAWAREGRSFLTAGALLRLPLYVLWKIPLYLGLTRKGAPTEWLRTGR